jgi:hypothetical protein
MSQAFGVVEGFGYPVEYVPFHVYAECKAEDWQGWLYRQLDQMIEFYGARALIFDGSMPYSGLLRATAPRRDLSLIWVRRAFWKPEQHNDDLVARQRFFDLIIEPEDIAESCDEGATVAERGRAARVPPIRLLDPEELLSRTEAAAALGLDPKHPAVLVQLGGGATRNLATLTDLILTGCADFPDLQVFVAEREASHRLPHRPLLPGLRFRRLGRWIQHLSRRALHRSAVDLRAGRPCDDGRPSGARPLCRERRRGDRSDAIHGGHSQVGVGIHARSADAAAAAGRVPQARRAERGRRCGPTHRRPTERVSQP